MSTWKTKVMEVKISVETVVLEGEVVMAPEAKGLILFAHGSGSSRHSRRNQAVAGALQTSGFATLLFDLLTEEEERTEDRDGRLRFDIPLLAQRLIGATEWVRAQESLRHLPIGYFGSSTGAGAALVAAASLGPTIGAVVSRGGRPDLAGEALPKVIAPTLLIVGEADMPVIDLNKQARKLMKCETLLTIVPGASHLFEESGALETVAQLASDWFRKHLGAPPSL